MSGTRASEQIVETVTAWPGVVAGPGRRGELAFKVEAARSATSTATTPPISRSRSRSGPS